MILLVTGSRLAHEPSAAGQWLSSVTYSLLRSVDDCWGQSMSIDKIFHEVYGLITRVISGISLMWYGKERFGACLQFGNPRLCIDCATTLVYSGFTQR